MANHMRLEYMNLLPWRRKGTGDDEMAMPDDISECGSTYHGHIHHRSSTPSTYSLNEGDLQFLSFVREETSGLAKQSVTTLPNDVVDMAASSVSLAALVQRLMSAIEDKDKGAVEYCIKHGVDVNSSLGIKNQMSPLHFAMMVKAPVEIVACLLKNGADVKTPDSKGITPIHLASTKGDAELVRRFLQAGADVNVRDFVIKDEDAGTVTGGETPLHRAALGGHLEVVEILIQHKAELNAFSSRGRTALHYAAQRGAVSCLQALLDAKADANAVDHHGHTALLLLGGNYLTKSNRRVSGYSEGVEALVKAGAAVNVCDRGTEVTPLHQAVSLGRIEAIRTLLAAGAIINSTDKEGVTPLHVCCWRGHAATLKMLLNFSATKEGLNVPDFKGRTALHKAAYRGSGECIQQLLKAGADLSAKTKSGLSCLTLILRLPTGNKILSQRLDESISTNSADPNEFACRLKFDYSILLSRNTQKQMGVLEDILDESPEIKTADLLQHPLIESFLFLKWRRIRLLFFSNIIFYLILVAGVTAYVLSSVAIDGELKNSTELLLHRQGAAGNASALTTAPQGETVLQLQMLLIVVVVIIIIQECIQFATLHVQYLREAESWIKLGALVTSTIVIFTHHPSPEKQWPKWVKHVSAFAVLFGWTEVTLLLGRLPTFGVYALMFYSVAQHLVKFIFVFFFFLAGFAFSFHIIFNDKAAFANPWSALLRTLAMMIGDANYDEYLTPIAPGNDNSLYGTAQIIYFVFLILVALILMNLLIGLAVNDIQGLQKEGIVKRLRKQAQFIVYLEDISCNLILKFIFRNWLQSKMMKWLNLNTTLVVNPAMRKPIIKLPTMIVQHALAIAQEGRKPVDRVTNRDTYNLVHDCIASIESLRERIEALERGLIGSANLMPRNSDPMVLSDDEDAGNEENQEDDGTDDDPMGDQEPSTDGSDTELLKLKVDDEIDGYQTGSGGGLGSYSLPMTAATSRDASMKRKIKMKRSLRTDLEDIKKMLTDIQVTTIKQNLS